MQLFIQYCRNILKLCGKPTGYSLAELEVILAYSEKNNLYGCVKNDLTITFQ